MISQLESYGTTRERAASVSYAEIEAAARRIMAAGGYPSVGGIDSEGIKARVDDHDCGGHASILERSGGPQRRAIRTTELQGFRGRSASTPRIPSSGHNNMGNRIRTRGTIHAEQR
jgi:hypothetical protein